MKLVSVIIPCYNASSFIEATIRSILEQTYPAIEIIVLNDGSTDNSADIIGKIRDERITLINKPNSGVSNTRNQGLGLAKGEYIVFFDNDDLMEKNFISERAGFLDKNPATDFCCGEVLYIDINDQPISPASKQGPRGDIIKEIVLLDSSISCLPSNFMYRAASLLKNGLHFNPLLSNSADKFFLLQAAMCLQYGGTVFGQDSKLLYRIHHLSLSSKVNEKRINDVMIFFREIIAKIRVEESIESQFYKKFLYMITAGLFKIKKVRKSLKYFFLLACEYTGITACRKYI
jgi:glycosyltransferase involved in cell wall biosynthesis